MWLGGCSFERGRAGVSFGHGQVDDCIVNNGDHIPEKEG